MSQPEPVQQNVTSSPPEGTPPTEGVAPSAASGVANPDGTFNYPLAPEHVEKVKDRVIEAVQNVYDPEIPVNIFELGLIYDVQVQPSGDVQIKMTLTSPACPAAQEIPVDVRVKVGRIPEVKQVDVQIVWDPPWGPNFMSEVAKVTLGMM